MTSSSRNEPIVFRFAGEDIAPNNVHARELADILAAAEDLLTAAVLREYHELTKDDIIVGLTAVTAGSLSLGFSPSLPNIVIPVFERLAETIQRQAFDLLPDGAREPLRRIATFTRKNRCTAELWVRDHKVPLAIIESTLVIPAAPRLFIQTTLYGRVLNAGGKIPNVHLETLNGDLVICKGTQEQVKKLAGQLYSWIGLSGAARCNVETLEIDDFAIDEILQYSDTPIAGAMQELGAVVGSHFDGLDVDAYVRALRDDDSEV